MDFFFGGYDNPPSLVAAAFCCPKKTTVATASSSNRSAIHQARPFSAALMAAEKLTVLGRRVSAWLCDSRSQASRHLRKNNGGNWGKMGFHWGLSRFNRIS